MIIGEGMNVYTSEAKNALQLCEGVAEVAVVMLPDPDSGLGRGRYRIRRAMARFPAGCGNPARPLQSHPFDIQGTQGHPAGGQPADYRLWQTR